LSYSLQLKTKAPSTLQWLDSEFILVDLDKKPFALSDVYYLLKLCCYENEQSSKFKLKKQNHLLCQRQGEFKTKGGIWGDI
jgi:hypothetical protein